MEAHRANAIDAVTSELDPEIAHLLEAYSAFVLLRRYEDHKIRRRDDGRGQCVQFLVFGLEFVNHDIGDPRLLPVELGLEVGNLRLLSANSGSEAAVRVGEITDLALEITVFTRGRAEFPDGSQCKRRSVHQLVIRIIAIVRKWGLMDIVISVHVG